MQSPAPSSQKPANAWKARSAWLRWAGTLLTAVLFAWLLARQDWEQVWETLSRLPGWLLPLALGLYIAGMLANALRWYVLLQAPNVPIPLWEVVKIVFLGAFVSNFLPSTVGGDAVRVVSLLRFTNDRIVSLASVMIDRLVNMTGMFLLLPLSLLTFGSPFALLQGMGGLAAPMLALADSGNGRGGRLSAFLKHWTRRGRETFQVWLGHPALMITALLISWLSVLVVFLAIWLLARGLNIQVALYQVVGVTALTYTLTLLPISVNGYGLREVAVTSLYMHLGASLEQASTLALITRFFMLIETLPGALWLSQSFSSPPKPEGMAYPEEKTKDPL